MTSPATQRNVLTHHSLYDFLYVNSLYLLSSLKTSQAFRGCGFFRHLRFIVSACLLFFVLFNPSSSLCNHSTPVTFRTMVQQEPVERVSNIYKIKGGYFIDMGSYEDTALCLMSEAAMRPSQIWRPQQIMSSYNT
jgi:hypothetical protein